MKHKLRIYAMAALVLCVTCVLAVGATLAQANTDSGQGGVNELKINVSKPESEVSEAQAEAQLYLVAYAYPDNYYDTYNYVFEDEYGNKSKFTELKDQLEQHTHIAGEWKDLATAAQGIVERDKLEPICTVPVGDTITNLRDGLYLVLIPEAKSKKYTFEFNPSFISMPGKVDAEGNPVYNTAQGTWVKSADAKYEINVKWSKKTLKGSLEVDKIVDKYSGDPVTFTFRIDGETDDGPYQNFITVSFDKDGKHTQTLNGIPAGYTYRVTEVNTGAGYQASGLDYRDVTIEAGKTYKIQGEDEAFRNEPDGSGNKGYGIENHFVYEKGGNWSPEKREINKPNNNPNE